MTSDISTKTATDPASSFPSEWSSATLEAILVPQAKSKAKAGEALPKGKYPFFNCSEKQTKFSDEAQVDGENIFITTGGDYLFTHFHQGKAAFSSDVWCLKAKGGFDTSFVNHALQYRNAEYQGFFQGLKLKHLDKKAFLKSHIYYPPLAEQRSISTILDDYQRILADIANLARVQEKLMIAVRSELISGRRRIDTSTKGAIWEKPETWTQMTINGVKTAVPAGWRLSTIGDEFRAVCGSTPSTATEAFWNGNIPWVTPADIGDTPGDLISIGARSITQLGAGTLRKRMAPKGSIIVTTRASIGRTAIADSDMYTNQGCHALIPEGDVSSEFIGHWVAGNADLLKSKSSGTTFLELPSAQLRSLEFAHPPMDEQEKICSALTEMRKSIEAIKSLLDLETKKFQWLRRQLLSGNMTIEESAAQE